MGVSCVNLASSLTGRTVARSAHLEATLTLQELLRAAFARRDMKRSTRHRAVPVHLASSLLRVLSANGARPPRSPLPPVQCTAKCALVDTKQMTTEQLAMPASLASTPRLTEPAKLALQASSLLDLLRARATSARLATSPIASALTAIHVILVTTQLMAATAKFVCLEVWPQTLELRSVAPARLAMATEHHKFVCRVLLALAAM